MLELYWKYYIEQKENNIMVISVTSTNISESSINDFFHITEIAVLELCNQAELDDKFFIR